MYIFIFSVTIRRHRANFKELSASEHELWVCFTSTVYREVALDQNAKTTANSQLVCTFMNWNNKLWAKISWETRKLRRVQTVAQSWPKKICVFECLFTWEQDGKWEETSVCVSLNFTFAISVSLLVIIQHAELAEKLPKRGLTSVHCAGHKSLTNGPALANVQLSAWFVTTLTWGQCYLDALTKIINKSAWKLQKK